MSNSPSPEQNEIFEAVKIAGKVSRSFFGPDLIADPRSPDFHQIRGMIVGEEMMAQVGDWHSESTYIQLAQERGVYTSLHLDRVSGAAARTAFSIANKVSHRASEKNYDTYFKSFRNRSMLGRSLQDCAEYAQITAYNKITKKKWFSR